MMSCACAAARIAETHTTSLGLAVHEAKRQRTRAQRCSNASDQSVVTTAAAAHTPTTGVNAATVVPSGELQAHAEAVTDHIATSSAVLQSAMPESDRCTMQPREDRCAMQPRAFYGPPHRSSGQHGGRQTAVELRVQRFLQGLKKRIIPSAPYQVFPQQAAAFEFADLHAQDHDLRVLSVETGSKGARQFIATTYQEFWMRYRRLESGRHYYEIVREGWPCHLYFDLEFNPEVNAGRDGDALVDTLLSDVAVGLQQRFHLTFEESDVLELDSSTPQKFSRHLVVALPGAAFAGNRDVAVLVAQLLGDDPLAGPYAVAKDAAGAKACFVDTSVYSRNRAFRLYLSSKAGKTAVLQPTGRLQPATAPQRDTFMASLICNVPPNVLLLQCSQPQGSSSPAWQRVKQQPPGRRRSGAGSSSLHAGQPPSPLPAVDAFLAAVCTQGGSQGYVRSWTRVDESVLLYAMGGNRWCGNIGRQHKSNGVYIVVDLSAGLWWQKCFDPDCRAYRSETMPLPQGCLPLPPPLPQPSNHSPPQSTRNSEGVLGQDASTVDEEAALAAAADEAEADDASLRALLDWESSGYPALQLSPSAGSLRSAT